MLKSLLLVEDHDSMRTLLRELVADLAEHVYECRNAAEAVALNTINQPTWVLMDIQTREANGLAATRHITETFPAAQVMIVTSHDDAATRAAVREAGASAFVAKENLLNVRHILAAQADLPTALAW